MKLGGKAEKHVVKSTSQVIIVGMALCAFLLSGFSITYAEPQDASDVLLAKLEQLTEEEIDVGEVSLLLAAEVFPDLNIQHYSAQLDRLANEIRRLTKGSTDPDYRIRAMNTYLYKHKGFHYDKEDMYALELKNRFLNGILDTKSGSCTTMPLLYIALAQRLGYPIYPVAAPQHLFCRYVDSNLAQNNIEATGGGGYSPDEDYIQVLEIPEKGIQSGAYLETMSYRQLVGDLIVENGTYWARQEDFIQAVKHLSLGIKLNPKAAEAWRILGYCYEQLAISYKDMDSGLPHLNNPTLIFTKQLYSGYSRDYRAQAEQAFERSKALGAAPPIEVNYWIIQKEREKAMSSQAAEKGEPNER